MRPAWFLAFMLVAGCVDPKGAAPDAAPCTAPPSAGALTLANGTALKIHLAGIGMAQIPIWVCRTTRVSFDVLPSTVDTKEPYPFFLAWVTGFQGGAVDGGPAATARYDEWHLPGDARIVPSEPTSVPINEANWAWLTVATNVPEYWLMVREAGLNADNGVVDAEVTLAQVPGLAEAHPKAVLRGTTMEWDANVTFDVSSRVIFRAWLVGPADGQGAVTYNEADRINGGRSGSSDRFSYGPTFERYAKAWKHSFTGFEGQTTQLSFHVDLTNAGDGQPDVGVAWITVPYLRE